MYLEMKVRLEAQKNVFVYLHTRVQTDTRVRIYASGGTVARPVHTTKMYINIFHILVDDAKFKYWQSSTIGYLYTITVCNFLI